MMGYRLHIPNVRPQVNSRHLKCLTYPHASSQWRHYLAPPHLTRVIKIVTCYRTHCIARVHACLLFQIPLPNTKLIYIKFKNPVPTAKKTHCISVTKIIQPMMFSETMAVYYENQMKALHTICGSNAELLSLKSRGSYVITVLKVKLSLCLTKHHAMKTCWGNGGIDPRVL
jgi:hypothetical protein